MAMAPERPVMALKPFNAMRIPEIKAALRHRNVRFKANGKKRVLYDLLVESMSAERVQSAGCLRDLVKLQACVRGWLVRNRLRVHGAAIFNRSICNNAVDPVTLTELDDIPAQFMFSFSITRPDIEIPPEEFFSNPDPKVTYGFDVRSLKSLLEKTMMENPFTREALPKSVQDRIHACFEVASPFRRVLSPRIATGSVDEQAFKCFHDIYLATGCFVDEAWFLRLDRLRLIDMFRHCYNTWRYRIGATPEIRRRFVPPGVHVFSNYGEMLGANPYHLRRILLSDFEKLLSHPQDPADRCTAAMWILIALTTVSDEAADALPHLAS
jgi:hypothetical protein